MMNGENSKLTVQMEYITAFFSFFNKSSFSSWWPSAYEMTYSIVSIIPAFNMWGVTLCLCQHCDKHEFRSVGHFMREFTKSITVSGLRIVAEVLEHRCKLPATILILVWIFALKATFQFRFSAVWWEQIALSFTLADYSKAALYNQ